MPTLVAMTTSFLSFQSGAEDLLSRFSQRPLRHAGAIESLTVAIVSGGIEEVHPKVDGPIHELGCVGVEGRNAKGSGSEANGRDFYPAVSKYTVFQSETFADQMITVVTCSVLSIADSGADA